MNSLFFPIRFFKMFIAKFNFNFQKAQNHEKVSKAVYRNSKYLPSHRRTLL